MSPLKIALLGLAFVGCSNSSTQSDLGAGPDLSVVDLYSPDLSLGAVGHACTAPGDCATGYCLTESSAPSYVGGYCTLRNCDADGGVCPSGSDCSGGGAIGSTACFVRCSDNSNCRAGYHCCPDFNHLKVCVPTTNTAISC
jgi:hypothetical protein